MDLVQMAREMGKALQASEEYKALKAAQEVNDNDTELQDLIGKFNLKRMTLNNLLANDEKDDDKINAANTELREVYQQIMSNEHMIAYNAARDTLDSIMTQVNTIISMSVNGEDPETIDPASCTGNCSTCGGCH